MIRKVRYGLLVTTLLAIPTSPVLGQSPGRPVVQPKTETERLLATMQTQREQLEASRESAAKFTNWFTAEKPKIETLRSTLGAAEGLTAQRRLSWNTQVNPTCTHGLTYADCDCDRGRVGKARMRDLITKAEEFEASMRKALNGSVQNYNTNLQRYRTLTTQAEQLRQTYNGNVDMVNRMMRDAGKPPAGSPDSLGDIEKRAKEHNPK